MNNLKIVVLTKFFKGELNPFDGAALECALQSGAKDITILTMAPMSALNAFSALTRLGVKGVFVSDPLYAGSDTIATSYILAAALQKLQPDLIFCGRQSIDGDTAQVPPMLAQRLGYTLQTQIVEITEGAFVHRSGQRIAPQRGSILCFERSKTLRFPSIFSKMGEVRIWDNQTLGLEREKCGLAGSPTRVKRSYESDVGRRSCTFVEGTQLARLIVEGLQKNRREEVLPTGEKLAKIAYVGQVQAVAQSLGEEVIPLSMEVPMSALNAELERLQPQAVLWEDDERSKQYASQVAAMLGVGICADCISFRVEHGQLVMTRPAQGGNVTADILCTGKMGFATVRTVRQDCADILFAVGKGGAPYLEKITELAKKYNAELVASRIVVDSGKMPYAAQVGLTGKRVCPKVYVAFGISGAVQHTCAISGAGTIIAVNLDKQARIFDYADYGIVADIQAL